MVALGKGRGRGGIWNQLQQNRGRLGQNRDRIFVSMDRKKHIMETKGNFLTDNVVICTEIFPSNTYKRAIVVLLLYISGQVSKNIVTLANNFFYLLY